MMDGSASLSGQINQCEELFSAFLYLLIHEKSYICSD